MGKNTALSLFIFSVCLVAGLVGSTGCKPTSKASSSVPETWDSISNRWSAVSVNKLQRAAGKGDVTAQYDLAIAHIRGLGMAKDEVEAFKWMKLAAQQGMPRAERWMGMMLQNGMGGATNLVEAAKWYRIGAEHGDAGAQMKLGWLYHFGAGVPQDYAEAARLYRLAATQGDEMAQNNLGLLYQNGSGVSRDPQEALKWYQKSAEQGEPLAQKNLAWMYASGAYGYSNPIGQGAEAQIRSGGFPPNHGEAEKWMRKAVDLTTTAGQYEFGCLLIREFDNDGHQDNARFPEGGDYFRKAAEQGHAEAQYQLALMYHNGQLGDNQRSNCIPWFLKAATQGNVEAQAIVGVLSEYYPNNNLLKSVNPVEMLYKSAEKGNLDAQFQLAKRYQTGDGVPKVPTEAFKWMERATRNEQQGSVVNNALYRLGLMYETGDGVLQDIRKSRELYVGAAFANFPDPNACFRVAQMFEKGEDLPQDDRKAVEQYYNAIIGPGHEFTSKAVESLFRLYADGRGFPKADQEGRMDHTDHQSRLKDIPAFIEYIHGMIDTPGAQFYVGEIYHRGKLVKRDLVESAAWLTLAAKQNLDNARKMLDQIEPEMSSAQKEAAKYRANVLATNLKSLH